MSGGTLTDQSSRWWSSARGRRGSAAAWESPAAPGWSEGSCCSLSSVKPLLSWNSSFSSINLQRSPISYFRATTFFSLPMSLLYPLLCIYGAWKKLFKKFSDQSSYLLPNSPDPSSLLPKLESPCPAPLISPRVPEDTFYDHCRPHKYSQNECRPYHTNPPRNVKISI